MATIAATVDRSFGNFDRISWDTITAGDTGEAIVAGQYSALCVRLVRVGATVGGSLVDGSTDGGLTWFNILSDGGSASVYRVIENPPELVRVRLADNTTSGATLTATATGKFSYLSGRC